MKYKQVWILLEGDDDERFFEVIIKPALENKYDFVRAWQYAQEPRKRTRDFLKSIKAMNSDYLFLADINDLPCVTAKKQKIVKKYNNIIDVRTVIVVVKEIESWYLAGLDDKSCKELKIRTIRRTDNITKEQFNKRIPQKFDSRIDFMVEILKRFFVETAKKKNRSFAYFTKKI